MKRCLRLVLIVSLLMSSAAYGAPPNGITLIGKGLVSGSSLDKSGLTGKICQQGNPSNCVPAAIFGGFGSDLTNTGHDDVYIAAPDRGPFDGLTDVPYFDRMNFLHITIDINKPFPNITTTLLDTRLLKNEAGKTFVGAAGAFANSEFNTLRLDPEGLRVGYNGTLYMSDEYGPYVFEFDRQGNIIRRLNVPAKFRIANPNADPNEELLKNTSGRQANRGMEGLAISPDGRMLFGMMQNALLQDNALTTGTTDRISVFTRILKIDLATGQTKEFIYKLDKSNRGQGVCEILAINDHEFLVIERDNRSFIAAAGPSRPESKVIYKIDLTGATDVSGLEGISASTLPAGVIPVDKKLFINLLEPTFGLDQDNSNAIPEKIEGLAWGPDLADGRHVLYVISDNDLDPNRATQIYAFAIDGAALNLKFEEQFIPGPLYPPGQVKKALGQKNE